MGLSYCEYIVVLSNEGRCVLSSSDTCVVPAYVGRMLVSGRIRVLCRSVWFLL